jgi:hypothetical protein
MRLRHILPIAAVLLAGCSHNTTAIAGSCIMAAKVDNAFYGLGAPVSASSVGVEYTKTTRYRDCEDVIEYGKAAPAPWVNGDSSFGPGTPLYTSLDHPTSEILLVKDGEGTFHEMRRLPNP